MEQIKIIHSADWHYADRDHDEIEKCVDAMIKRGREEEPDLIVVSGDITDSQNLKLDSRSAKTICRQFSELADIAPVVNIIGTPSHDGRSAEILRYVQGTYQIHISEKPEQLYLVGEGLYTADSGIPSDLVEAVITQIPTPTKQFFQSENSITESDQQIAEALSHLFGAFGTMAERFSCPHILNGHFQVGGAFVSETQQLIGRDIEVSTDQLAMSNADLVCLGHIHKAQEMPGNIFYAGSIYRKSFGEMEDKGFYLHEISPAELDSYLLSSRFVETPTRKLVKWDEDFTKAPIGEEFIFNTEQVEGAHLKLDFRVWQDEAGQINQAELERSLLDAGAVKVDINLIRIPRETVRCARVLQMETLREKVTEMAALRLEEVSEEILTKADLLETMNEDELVRVAGRVN